MVIVQRIKTIYIMDTEHTIIDGDILEDTFEDHSGTFDRFTHVIVCNPEGVFFRAIPYIYARNITRVRECLTTISVEMYPELREYAIRDELLQMCSINPPLLCSLVDKQDEVIPAIYQELRELEQLEMLDEASAESLARRLKAFFKTIKVGNYQGDGIFWLPENYQGDADEDIQRERNEDYDSYMRRSICRHIKLRRLPMAHLIPVPEERKVMLGTIIDSLSNYRTNVAYYAQFTHYAPIFRDRSDMRLHCLKTLMAEEFRCVKNEEMVNGNSLFIFNDAMLDVRTDCTIDTKTARDHLRYYVGDYFDELDLSRSFITGSAITASIIKTIHQYSHNYESREMMIDILFPKLITEFSSEDLDELKRENINLWDINALNEEEGIMTKGDKVIRFSIKSGADIDLAIDNTVSDEEYMEIVERHFNVIHRYFPYVKIRQYTKPKGDWNYVIYTDDPAYIPVFRTVEIYRSSFRNICSHHVGAVRGCFTARWSNTPQFYLTASAVMTSWTHCTPNYHYFAGRKSNPQDIIIKNMQRGINVSDEVLNRIITLYLDEKNITLSHLPFYEGRNVPFSIFAAPLEYPSIQVIWQRYQEAERRQRERDEARNRRNNNLTVQKAMRRNLGQSPPTDIRLQAHLDRERRQFMVENGLPQLELPNLPFPNWPGWQNPNSQSYDTVSTPEVPQPGAYPPPLVLPRVSPPQLRLPNVNGNIPQIPLPKVSPPPIGIPLPKVSPPPIGIPQIPLPNINSPIVGIPHIPLPNGNSPIVGIPQIPQPINILPKNQEDMERELQSLKWNT